ncbi:MAG: hypothetical protein KIT16_08725 [Rhodospirillaceae bacterium]|nr:hypothetical protein [Rhodospirillaceae bacterium]
MTIAYFITYSGAPEFGEPLRAWLKGAPADLFKKAPGLKSLDLYTPERAAQDPYLHDGAPPLAMLQAGFASLEALEAFLATPEFRATMIAPSPAPPDKVAAVHDAMEQRFYPVAGETTPGPLVAPISYVVRYQRPADNEAAFVEHYVTHHPQIQARFPRIRSIMCYVPIKWTDPTPITPASYLLGNEVVFDSVDDLDGSLNSPVRHELREDFKTFPKFSGRNTHYAMRRTRLAG